MSAEFTIRKCFFENALARLFFNFLGSATSHNFGQWLDFGVVSRNFDSDMYNLFKIMLQVGDSQKFAYTPLHFPFPKKKKKR